MPTGAGNAYGIALTGGGGDGSVVDGNIVSEISKPAGGGASYGIYVAGVNLSGTIFRSEDIAVTNNKVAFMNYGIYYNTYASGIYANNLAMRCDTPFTGGTGAGTTNYSN